MTLFDEGTYRARAVQGSAMLGYTSKRTEQVAVLLQFQDGDYQGQTIGWYGYFSDKTLERTIESLRYMGWRGDDLFDMSSVGDNDAPDVNVVIEHETDDQGDVRARVRWVNQIGIGMKERMDDASVREFSERMKGTVLALKQKSGAPKNNGNPNAQRRSSRSAGRDDYQAPPPGDDDIPF